jgi:hypothetical protein
LGQRVGAQTEKQGKAREEAIFTFIGGHKITFMTITFMKVAGNYLYDI